MLKTFLIRTACIAAIALSAGCASRAPFVQEPNLTSANSATVIVYRPQTLFHSLNPERPFLYVDEKQAGKLAVGSSIRITLKPGQYRLSMREPILFQPSYESRAVTLTVDAGETYYVRYSREMAGIVLLPGSAVMTSSTGFSVVPAEIGAAAR